QLLDRCMKCGAPVCFNKAVWNGQYRQPSDRMTFCYLCGADLRQIYPKSAAIARMAVSADEIIFQKLLETTLENGWIDVPGSGPIYSQLYFPVLYQLMILLFASSRAAELRDSLSQRCGIKTFRINTNIKKKRINRLGVSERRRLLGMARLLLANWPHEFTDFCSANKVWSRNLFEDFRPVPFWFWSVVHDHLTRTWHKTSEEEIESATRYWDRLKKQHDRARNRYTGELKIVAEYFL